MGHCLVDAVRCAIVLSILTAPAVALAENNEPPAGFVALFNGEDLAGWQGLIGRGDPRKILATSPAERSAAQREADASLRQHWKVENGEIVNDGKGPYLCTARDYGDFELLIDYKMAPGADSGIYLRGTPQVQIWDPVNGIQQAKVGSGGLYNNQKHPSKPLVLADRPAGEWNRFRILMLGERVSVHLNDQLVVDDVLMENYWERDRPIYPVGQIQLQTHGGEMRFRNVFLREIPRRPPESGVLALGNTAGKDDPPIIGKPVGPGWTDLLGGRGEELSGWKYEPEYWSLAGGVLTGKTPGTPQHHYAYTEKHYGDFELHAKVRMSGENANSGVCIRTRPASFDDVPGYQVDMGDGFWGCLWEERRDGMVDEYPKADADRIVKKDDWNEYYVLARGHHIQAWLNGVPTIDAYHPRGFSDGAIGFQLCHGENRKFTVSFRDVYLRELGENNHVDFRPPARPPGFADIFNGKDLTGWTGAVKGFTARNGRLMSNRRGGGNLITEKEYSDFVMQFEFKLQPGGNNGVGIRYPGSGDSAYVGYEIQILENTHPSYASLKRYQYHGSIYDLVPAKRGFQKPVGYWNFEEITVQGDHMTVKLNGQTIVDASVARKNFDAEKIRRHPGLNRTSGHIGFLGHGHAIEFKNIRVKELR